MTVHCDIMEGSKPFELDQASRQQLNEWLESRHLFLAELQSYLKTLVRPNEIYVRREEACAVVNPTPYAAIQLGELRFTDEVGRHQCSVAYLQVYPNDLVLDIYQGYRAAVAIYGRRYNPEDVGL